MSEPKKITLTKPVQFGQKEITELSFREPRAGDFWNLPIEKQTVGDIMMLASLLCAQPPAVLQKLEIADMEQVLTITGGFIAAGLGMPTKP